jgi:hypothetical protein
LVLLTYREAIEEYGHRSAVRRRVDAGELRPVRRNLYSTSPYSDPLAEVMKLYPRAVATGLTAYYIHGLTDHVPAAIDLATNRNATRINDPEVKQHLVDASYFEVGASAIDFNGTEVRVYDQERMLFHLLSHAKKLPFDLYKEVLAAYRKRTGDLDYAKLQEYSRLLPGGRTNLERIIKEVL